MEKGNSDEMIERAFDNARIRLKQEYSIEAIKNKFPKYIRMMEKFSELVGEDAKILDAGCGQGRDILFFKRKGLEPVGIDISTELLREAREKGAEVMNMDVRNLSFDKRTFDGVWCNSVLQFLSPQEGEMERAIKELTRVTKPGGIIYVNFKLGKGSKIREDYDPSLKEFHLTRSQIKNILNGIPLSVVYSEKNNEINTIGLFLEKSS